MKQNEKIIELMTGKISYSNNTLSDLSNVVKKYPYFQIAHLLHTLNLLQLQDSHFLFDLRKTAVYIPDRTQLFFRIKDNFFTPDLLDAIEKGTLPIDSTFPFLTDSVEIKEQIKSKPESRKKIELKKEAPVKEEYESVEIGDPEIEEYESLEIEDPEIEEYENAEIETPEKEEYESAEIEDPEKEEYESLEIEVPEKEEYESIEVEDPEKEEYESIEIEDPEKEEYESIEIEDPEEEEYENIEKVEPKKNGRESALNPTDYVSYLLSDIIDDNNAPPLRHQAAVDRFLEKDAISPVKITLNQSNEFEKEFSETFPEQPNTEDFFSETLAKIYIKQKNYGKALEIIHKLNLLYPEKNRYFADQIRFLEKLIINTNNI